MAKIILFLFSVLFIVMIGFSQEETYQLEKYSYKLTMINNKQPIGFATGFFIKNKKNYFLVSNYHVFAGVNTITGLSEIDHPFDTILVEYLLKGKKGSKVNFAINVVKIKALNKPKHFWEYPDIFAFKILIPHNAKIFSIEHFLKPIPNHINPEKIIAFGYPGTNPVLTKFGFKVLDTNAIYRTFSGTLDNGNIIEVKNSYRVMNESKPGMSGAPVFLKYKNQNFIFGGVISSHAPNQTLIVKPEEFIKLINL